MLQYTLETNPGNLIQLQILPVPSSKEAEEYLDLGNIDIVVLVEGREFESSSIFLFVYEPLSKELGIVFKRSTSIIYIYQGVSLLTFLQFFLADSQGKYIQTIKRSYSSVKLELVEFMQTLTSRYST